LTYTADNFQQAKF